MSVSRSSRIVRHERILEFTHVEWEVVDGQKSPLAFSRLVEAADDGDRVTPRAIKNEIPPQVVNRINGVARADVLQLWIDLPPELADFRARNESAGLIAHGHLE